MQLLGSNCSPLYVIGSIGMLLNLSVLSVSTYGSQYDCGTGDIVYEDVETEDSRSACAGADKAKHFLSSLGLRTDVRITMNVVDQLTFCKTESAVGCYKMNDGSVEILKFSAIKESKGDKIFNLEWSVDFYESISAHESAHVVINHNRSYPRLSWLSHEYIAYVTQIATMPIELRERILYLYTAEAFGSTWEINATILMMSPALFSARAYRHFMRPENGKKFIRALLDGEELPGNGPYP